MGLFHYSLCGSLSLSKQGLGVGRGVGEAQMPAGGSVYQDELMCEVLWQNFRALCLKMAMTSSNS